MNQLCIRLYISLRQAERWFLIVGLTVTQYSKWNVKDTNYRTMDLWTTHWISLNPDVNFQPEGTHNLFSFVARSKLGQHPKRICVYLTNPAIFCLPKLQGVLQITAKLYFGKTRKFFQVCLVEKHLYICITILRFVCLNLGHQCYWVFF